MMQATPAKAMWLIARLRLQRLWNMMSPFRFKPGNSANSRPATAMKKGAGGILAALITSVMLFSFTFIARDSVINAQCYLVPMSACAPVEQGAGTLPRVDKAAAVRELHMAPFEPQVVRALSFQLSLLLVIAFLIPLASREIATADWDLEWLVTLPARRSTLLWGRIVERTVVNPAGWLFLVPTSGMFAWYSGFGWASVPAAVLASTVLLAMAAMLRTIVDTGLRMSMPPSRLRNIQAITGIMGLPIMYMATAMGTIRGESFVLRVLREVPEWVTWTPGGLLVRLIDAQSAGSAALALGVLAAQVFVILGGGMLLLNYQLRAGVVGSGARETGRRPKKADAPAGGWIDRLLPSSPIKRRELRLLARDRNFMVQCILLPLVIFGSQFMVNSSPDALSDLANSPRFIGSLAFGLGSYMLMLSAFQTINTEGHSLWILYTFPRPIETVLKEKAEFWAVMALIYPAIIMAAVLWAAPAKAVNTLGMFAVVLAGMPIFSLIAVSLGVFASNPLSQDPRSKVRITYVYLYMLLSGMYVYAVTTALWSHKLVLIILMALLATALWQKARDRLPFLLDPGVTAPARVSTADGLIAAVLFFVLQGVLMFLLSKVRKIGLAEAMVLAFSAAGLLVFGIMRLVLWRTRAQGVPALFNDRKAQALGWGLAGGAFAGVLGAAYLAAIAHFGLFPEMTANKQTLLATHWLILLAVVAAPLCEEFIFRGLIFAGLRRSMGAWQSILLSAALFAIVHPPASIAPVFVLGVVTAWVYERNRSLLGPIVVHAVYNGVMLGLQ